MGLLSGLFNKEDFLPVCGDTDVVAPVAGLMYPVSEVKDEMFAQEMMGQTIAFHPEGKKVVSPANGILEVLYPTGHAFAVRMKNGTGLLVHIGIDTVNLKGKGFAVKAVQGSEVKAGQTIVEVNWNKIREAGLDTSTMLIVTDKGHVNFIENGMIKLGQIISK